MSQLLSERRDVTASGPVDVEVTGLACDSRRVLPGFLYCALKGERTDGMEFVPAALGNGAIGVLSGEPPTHGGVTWLRAARPRRAMADAAAIFHDHPSRKLRVAGVTGTNGKTTVSFLLHHLMKCSMRRAGLIGTIRYDDGLKEGKPTHTTPESVDLQAWLARMVENQCGGVAMEVSSHAVVQDRVHQIAFDTAIFTNLSQDHLDFHGTMEEYFEAKAVFFDQLAAQPGKKPTAVINTDDPAGRRLIGRLGDRVKVVRYGLGPGADFRASNVRFDATGGTYQLEVGLRKLLVRLPLIGRFNVYNSLAALAGAAACGLNLREAVANVALAPQVPGRLENVAEKRPFRVIVDYAHTPDALENALGTLRELGPRRLLTVFGCGGDRDRRKRPLMGAVAERLSDFAFLTSDNPRTENPAAILEDIRAGFQGSRFQVIPDRSEAIARAIDLAEDGDTILIAGKGHEDYQIFADHTIEFDDRKVARRCLERKLSGATPEPPPSRGPSSRRIR